MFCKIHSHSKIHRLSYVGDNSQLKPFKSIGNKFTLCDSLFDLPISHAMERFTIFGQHRCTQSYQAFLRNISLDYSSIITLFTKNFH